MPNPITATIAGVLLFDAAARVIASVGVGSDPRLNSLTADQAWMAEAVLECCIAR